MARRKKITASLRFMISSACGLKRPFSCVAGGSQPRAIALTPSGLRLTAYPSAMPLLVQMGLVEGRAASRIAHRDGRAWFLAVQGRETVKAYGVDEA